MVFIFSVPQFRTLALWLAILLAFHVFPCCANAAPTLDELVRDGQYDAAVRASAVEPTHYLAQLISTARAQGLAKHPVWHALVHYHPSFWHASLSEVDGMEFFNAQAGKTDPQAELEATLAAFFARASPAPQALTPQCLFPARYFWLKAQLHFDATRLAEQACEKLNVYRQALNAESITIVFPSAQPDSPSSMFGHTSLRFDRPKQDKNTRMLAYTANYAAVVDTSNNVFYALKGLTGNFSGRFSILPYYLKLREYAQMENRDIWEYTLVLSRAQVDFLVLHAYELALTYFDYYFFTENCSYQLMALLAAAAPDLKLDDYNGWVIPVDTLKKLVHHRLVSDTAYHPSYRTTITARRKLLSPEDRQLALGIFRQGLNTADTPVDHLDPPRRAAVLDLAYDYQRYTKIKNADVLEAKVSEKERELLLARSQISVPSATLDIPTPETRPDQGHDTARATFGFGARAGDAFASLGVRGAYHDMLDPSAGYSTHTQLEFVNIEARYLMPTRRMILQRLTLVDLISLDPRDDFFGNWSWRLNTGWINRAPSPDQSQLAYTLNGGPGVSYQFGDSDAYGYGFLEGALEYGAVYENHYALNLGASLGVLMNHGGLRTQLSVRALPGVAGDTQAQRALLLQQGIGLSQNFALEWTVGREQVLGNYATEITAKLRWYF